MQLTLAQFTEILAEHRAEESLYWTKVSKTEKWGKFSGKGFKYPVLYLMEKRYRCLQGTEVENP